MPKGYKVGEAYIEVTPELELKRFKYTVKQHLKDMAKEATKSLRDSQQDMMAGFNKQVAALQQGKTKGVFAQHRAEMLSWQKLQKQRDAATKAQMKNLEMLGKAEYQAYAMERKRIEAIQKAEIQAYQAKEKMDRAAADRAVQRRYREARMQGATPSAAAGFALDRSIKSRDLTGQLAALEGRARMSGAAMAKAFDSASHHLSQLSTRIGLASFQLQLLGGFATTFFTGPAAYGFAVVARDGLKFAANIDYARASMKALLGPAADVEKIIRDIQKIAIESPLFNTDEAVTYAQKLAAVGVKEKDLAKTIKSLGNIFLTGGVAGPERAGLALMAYTQILSKGSIGMDDLRQQLAEHLPTAFGVFGEAAKLLGYKDLPALQKAMKEGKVTSEQLNQAFIKLGNSPKYLEGATQAAQTLGGVWQGFVEEMQSRIGMAFYANRKEIIDAINGIRPVMMGLIDEFVKALPTMIDWLGRLIAKAQQLKAWWDELNPAQKEMVQQLVLVGLAAGPAAIAIGIFGTALSGAANAASLMMKSAGLLGTAIGASTGWIGVAVLAIGALVTALGIAYTQSKGMRTAILRVLNQVKDFIASVILPVLDRLIGSFKSLEDTFGFLGLKSEHLAYIIGFVLMIPLVALLQIMVAIIAIIKTVQFVMLVLASIAYAVTNAVAYLIMAFRELFELIAKIPGAEDWAKPIAESADRAAKKLGGLVDVSGQWEGLTKANSNATDGLQSRMNNLDLTTSGLTGAFGGWNNMLDQSINKQWTLTDAINTAREAMQSQGNTARSLVDASDNWNQSLISLKESIKANGKTLNEKTRQGQANRQMLKSATQASYEMMLQDIKSGVPMDQAIKRHKDRTKALKDEFGKNKETRAEADKLIESYGKVPKDVHTLLKLMGWDGTAGKLQQILAAQKVAANPGMSYSKALYAERKAWEANKFAGGGLITGPGGPTEDKIPIWASDQEYMVRAASVAKLGKPVLDYINRTGQLPMQQFAKGGQVTWPFNVDISQTKFPPMIGGPAGGGGIGWARMMAVLRQRFPGLDLISGYRPGAITSTGNRSWHALGRAVDLPPRMDVFQWIAQNYGRSTKELFYTPAGGRQIVNGQLRAPTGGTIARDHYDHVHWAYDNGGQIAPNQPFINKTGANELALNAAQGKALENKIRNSDRPINVTVYVDGVKRDAEIVFDEKADQLIQALGGL